MLVMGLIIFACVCLVIVIINQILILRNEYKFNEEIEQQINNKMKDIDLRLKQIDVDKYRKLTKGIEIKK